MSPSSVSSALSTAAEPAPPDPAPVSLGDDAKHLLDALPYPAGWCDHYGTLHHTNDLWREASSASLSALDPRTLAAGDTVTELWPANSELAEDLSRVLARNTPSARHRIPDTAIDLFWRYCPLGGCDGALLQVLPQTSPAPSAEVPDSAPPPSSPRTACSRA